MSVSPSLWLKKTSTELGFFQCGIARATRLEEDAARLEAWLHKGFHGEMQYMERYFDQRCDPRLLVDGAKSVITLLFNYYPEKKQDERLPKISCYAYGTDYHEVIRKKLKELLFRMQEQWGNIQGRGFVDSAPVLERSWALRSGLGWIGKNGNLITRQQGSFFFIATLIVDLELDYDPPFSGDYCGTCTRCIDACPTQAILLHREIDGSRCISYFTIELKNQIPEQSNPWNDWIFGCDSCMDVCPWNRFSKPHQEPAFEPLQEIMQFSVSDWMSLGEESFRHIFKHSPLKRSGYQGILRNLRFVKKDETNR